MGLKISPPRSIKTQITLFTLSLFLVLICSLIIVITQILHAYMEKSLGDAQYSMVSLHADEINRELHQRLAALETIATNIDPAMMAQPADFQQMFNEGTCFTGRGGVAIAEYPRDGGRLGVSYMDREAIQRAINEAKTTINQPVIGRPQSAPVLGIATPVFDQHQHVIGALAGVINLAKPNFLDNITKTPYGKTGSFLLLALPSRLIITGTDKQGIMGELPAPGVIPAMDRFLQGYEGSTVYIKPSGLEILTSARKIPATDWMIFVSMSTAEAFAPVHALLKRTLIAVLVFTVLATVLVWWMLHRSLAPLGHTAATLLRLAHQEEPPAHLPITSQNEIGTLILAFNRMIDCLNKRQQSLRNSEQKLFTILENVEAHIYLKDLAGRYVFANRLVRELFGVNGIEDVVGQTDARFFDSATVEQLRINDRQVLHHGLTLRTEETNLNLHTGLTSTYLSVKIPLRDENGKIYALCGISTDISDRKRHEEQLNAALAQAHRFQQALDNISAYIYMKDKQHRYVFANKTTLELFGCNLEQLIGSEDTRFFPPETAALIYDIDTRILEHGENSAEEITVCHLDGSRKIYWEVKTPIHDERHPDEIWGVCGISTDITDRKKIEETLALKEETLRAILETTNECVKLVAHDGTLISMNRAGLKLIEATSAEQVVGRSVYDLIASEDRESYRMFNERICQGESGSMQYEIIGLQGHRRWMETHAVPFSPPGTSETLQLAFTEEITTRKLNEQALIESETRMRTLFEATTDAVMLLNDKGFIDCNPATLRLFGCESKEIFISYHPVDLSPPLQPCGTDSLTLAHQQMAKAIREGSNRFEWIHKHLVTGALFTAEVSLNLMSFTDHYLLQAVVRDITERKRFEHELERQAHYDFLTNVYNRRHFMQLADNELARSMRYDSVLSLLMLDIDYFKNINDSQGHKAGDIALQKLAEICRHTLRQVDIIGRLGGEEFAILLPETALAEAQETAERLRLAIAQLEVSLDNGLPFHFTVSIGVTAPTSRHENLDTLLNQADQALYAAKHGGRNKVEVWLRA